MKRKFTPLVRIVALALALMLAGDATGAFAAVVLVVEQDACCHAAQSAPACPVAMCVLAGCLPRALDFHDDAVNVNLSAGRERWPVADEFGLARTDEPPVPPPRV